MFRFGPLAVFIFGAVRCIQIDWTVGAVIMGFGLGFLSALEFARKINYR